MSEPEDSNVLSRWSRRKRAAREEEALEAKPAPETVKEPADAEAIAAREAELEANRKAAEAVDLTKLGEKCDFSVFMKDGVPHLLRKQAMAALWRSNPVYANLDGLVDHGEDYGSPDLIMKTLKSGWQVGRGYLKELPAAPDSAVTAADAGDADVTAANAPDPVEDAGSDVSDGDADAAETTPVASEAVPEDAAAAENVPFEPEEEPVPRVSLRRRFALE